MGKKNFQAGQLIPTSSTPPGNAGFYRIDKNTIGVVGNLVQKNANTNAESNVASGANLAAELAAIGMSDVVMGGRYISATLPTHHSVLNPDDVSGLPLVSGSLTMSYDTTVKESGAGSIKLSASGVVTSVNLRCPLSAGAEYGQLPKVGGRANIRIRCSDWSKVTRLYVYFGQGGGITNAYFISVIESGKSYYPMMATTHQSAWNDAWRTIPIDTSKNRSTVGSPATWGTSASDRMFYTDGVAFTLTTTGAVDLWVDRIYSPEWPVGFVSVILDGSYTTARNTLFSDFKQRGWRGGSSLFHSSPISSGAQHPTAEDLKAMSLAGWDIFPHGLNTATNSAFSVASTKAEITAARADQLRWLRNVANVDNRGLAFSQYLTNSGACSTSDMAQVQLSMGALFGRADCGDSEYGVDPAHTNAWSIYTGIEVAGYQAGWCSSRGRFNLIYQPAYDGLATPTARDTYSGSYLEKSIKWAADMADGVIAYFHNIVPYDGTNPTTNDVGTNLYRDMLSDLDSKVSSGSLIVISPTDYYYLTYGRPGPVYMRWDGEWVDRSTGLIAF